MKRLLPVSTLLLAIFMLMAGSGALPAILGLRLDASGHSAPVIGFLGTGYFVGLTIGSILVFKVIGGVGHIRAFAAFVSVYAASALGYALVENLPAWFVLRLINGFCVAGVFVCLESWLNERADPEARGVTLAFYMIALYGGQALAQTQLGLSASPQLPFIVAALILSLTVVPVALTRMVEPVLGEHERFSMRRLYAISPLGLVGTAVTGLMLGAFYSLGAVQAQRSGLSSSETAALISFVIAGGMALQWPLGRLSDRFDRRKVIVATMAAAALVCFGMALPSSPAGLTGLGVLFGGFSFALYPLCVAHANDHLAVHERTGASGGLILAYSGGAALGPMLGAVAMRLAGPGGLYLYIGGCAALAFGFGIWRQLVARPVPGEDQYAFQVLPRTTPMVAALDPELPASEESGPV
ncbi:MAG: MFS transporter [Novosphingobium sp.]|nr:MFS transporter [Novosphingobium sp.]